MLPAVRWRAPTRPPKSAANSFEQLPPESPERWRALLGRKISIRYALAGDPDHPFSEAIGVVSGISDEDGVPVITIMKRDGRTETVRTADILAGKVWPI